MGAASGIELAKVLQRRLPDLPVLLASGYSHVLAQDGLHGFELLHKPYSADQLGRILGKVVPPRTAATDGQVGGTQDHAGFPSESSWDGTTRTS
ncbi:multi-sensor hybrid histidine kinase [Methylorubrum populi]|uniref:Multi-sensor hybrid histidine kinase n=1 Tax=Methylorubrum populi TaxID=223967 RepID=A0A169QEQ6_9HYPH|nr:hypothetical protein [Methylorubrum populi]BAU88783.1 multi-sensor hybrid histidine kinase [Methylorubrum populi]